MVKWISKNSFLWRSFSRIFDKTLTTATEIAAPTAGIPASQRLSASFRVIADNYNTVEEVQRALRQSGLESSNLIVAVDFTKSNEWTGKHSFGGKCLHAIGEVPSPYEYAITSISKTLSAFDDDGLIPSYGFGDVLTNDKSVFSFLPEDKPCKGLDEVLRRYRELSACVKMSGPTSFAPAIRQACRIVEQSGNQYHILLLLADGQVTRPSSSLPGQYSKQEQDTSDAIVEASQLPLSIVMLGVGDGPWECMKDFDDALPTRQFDNFQFVNFTELMPTTSSDTQQQEAMFALKALMEIPEQYQIIQELGLMSRGKAGRTSASRRRQGNPPLDPPDLHNFMSSLNSTSASTPAQVAYKASAPPLPATSGIRASGGDCGKTTAGSGKEPSSLYLCPITHDVMTDPVIATDGFTYERSAITEWLKMKTVSPMTNERIRSGAGLIPNHSLRSSILEWKRNEGVK